MGRKVNKEFRKRKRIWTSELLSNANNPGKQSKYSPRAVADALRTSSAKDTNRCRKCVYSQAVKSCPYGVRCRYQNIHKQSAKDSIHAYTGAGHRALTCQDIISTPSQYAKAESGEFQYLNVGALARRSCAMPTAILDTGFQGWQLLGPRYSRQI